MTPEPFSQSLPSQLSPSQLSPSQLSPSQLAPSNSVIQPPQPPLPSGFFACYLPNGDYYEGEVQEGKREGQGTLRTTAGEYVGLWKDDTILTGQFKDAYGKVYYEGKFGDFKKNGEGVEQQDGEIFKGFWKNDLRHGWGLKTSGNKNTTCFYQDGQLLQELSVTEEDQIQKLKKQMDQNNRLELQYQNKIKALETQLEEARVYEKNPKSFPTNCMRRKKSWKNSNGRI